VIGRNGAGKSTLLKVLSRITPPTEGRIELRGRSASLLEVGTGFHPELTGRENVYLNGTILGMRKRDIDRKFDEIVEFAEVARFIDTPVKRYSSGMYVRLAFGVAAHLDPEILVVDEVLAVGDAEFQKKCLGKMSDVASEGRTVLFVSHNMAAVRAICDSGLLLARGKVVERGPVDDVLSVYARQTIASAGAALTFPITSPKPQFVSLSLTDPIVGFGDTLEIKGELHSPFPATVAVEFEIHDERGTPIAYMATAPVGATLFPLEAGRVHEFTLRVGPLPLATGSYSLYFGITKPWAETYDQPSAPLTFEVAHSDPEESGFEFRQSYGRGAATFPLQSEFR
jgi:lipopolysaccharide transport system ATP-binding protein